MCIYKYILSKKHTRHVSYMFRLKATHSIKHTYSAQCTVIGDILGNIADKHGDAVVTILNPKSNQSA